MEIYSCTDANELYSKLIPDIVNKGTPVVAAENKKDGREDYKSEIVELPQVCYSIEDSFKCITSIDGMMQTPFWGISECVTEILGLNPPLMDDYSPKIMEWSYLLQESRMPRYLYGTRWANYETLRNVFLKLKKNPTSKKCWSPIFQGYDTCNAHKDVPCTLGHFFRIANGKLNLNTIFRSHDCFAGLRYDILLSQFLQWTMVGWLNGEGVQVEPGELTFFDESLHYYQHKDEEKYNAFIAAKDNFSEKLYHSEEDRKNLMNSLSTEWNITDYYKDLRELRRIERVSFYNRCRPSYSLLSSAKEKMSIPLFQDWTIMYLLKNNNCRFGDIKSDIHYDFNRRWFEIFFDKNE
jgi:thymidylate synthase